MSAKAKGKSVSKGDDNVIRLSLFDRPLASGQVEEKFTLYNYLTLKNMVLALATATLLIFIGNAVSVRLAILFTVLIGFFGIVLRELSSRRKWEKEMVEKLHRMGMDYDRLVRDVARNRNDMAALRKKLADAAGMASRTTGRTPGEPVEQRMIRALIEQLSGLGEAAQDERPVAEAEPILPEIGAAVSGNAAHLTESQVMQLLRAAVRQDRIDLFLQPIVGLPQRKVRFYEMFSRIRIKDDAYLPAGRYIDVANRQELMPIIDNLLLLRGLQIIRNTGEGEYNHAFFFNITSLTLNDPKFMGDLVEFIAQNRTLAPRLIFELSQKDLATMNVDVLPILDGLSKLGCRFSMDQVKSLSLNFPHLDARHIRFIKIEGPLLMAELSEKGGLEKMQRLKGELDRHGIDLIVEKIERDKALLELMDIDIDYGQGYLFGKPVRYSKG